MKNTSFLLSFYRVICQTSPTDRTPLFAPILRRRVPVVPVSQNIQNSEIFSLKLHTLPLRLKKYFWKFLCFFCIFRWEYLLIQCLWLLPQFAENPQPLIRLQIKSKELKNRWQIRSRKLSYDLILKNRYFKSMEFQIHTWIIIQKLWKKDGNKYNKR